MLLKLSRLLESLSFKFKQKAMYFELKHYIKQGENHLTHVYYYTRGIGKSFTLLQLAHKYNCPILVKYERSKNFLESLNHKHFKSPIKVTVINERSRGKRLGLVLLEEDIDNKIFHEIIRPMCKQYVGFEFIQ